MKLPTSPAKKSTSTVALIWTDSKASLLSSFLEARRLIQGGGVKVDGKQVTDPNALLDAAGEYVVSKGKNKFVKAIVK